MSANETVVIGLTGGIGSGKSEAARILAELGARHVNADEISRALTAPGGEALPEIRRVFGDAAFRADGSLDRRALGAAVFSDPNARRALEMIVHPRVQRETLLRLDAARDEGAPAVVLDVPLLFETGMDALCDVTWVIFAPVETRILRVMRRDALSREDVQARIASQMSDEERAARATKVISNDQSVEKLRAELTGLYKAATR